MRLGGHRIVSFGDRERPSPSLKDVIKSYQKYVDMIKQMTRGGLYELDTHPRFKKGEELYLIELLNYYEDEMVFRILAISKREYESDNLTRDDLYIMRYFEISDLKRIKPKDLPLYVSWEVKSDKFMDLLKN